MIKIIQFYVFDSEKCLVLLSKDSRIQHYFNACASHLLEDQMDLFTVHQMPEYCFWFPEIKPLDFIPATVMLSLANKLQHSTFSELFMLCKSHMT